MLGMIRFSQTVKALETDLGCRPFDRMSKRVLLTQAGEHLLQHADKILFEMSAARESINQLGKWGRGRLRVGASTTACQYILPAELAEKTFINLCRAHTQRLVN